MEKYQARAEKLVSAYRQRNILYDRYDQAFHGAWELPAELKPVAWMRAVTSMGPHDAVVAGTTVLSTLDPAITYQPLHDNVETKKEANLIERNLAWQLKNSEARRQGGVTRDIVHSALRYDEVCARVIDLDHEISEMDKQSADTTRLKSLRRGGRFLVNTYNPRNVYARYSNYGVEAVLLKESRTVESIQDEWGQKAKGLDKLDEEQREKPVTYYDYTDHTNRAVWAQAGDGDPVVILSPGPHKMEFMNWVAIVGGTTLESKPEHKRHPLLYGVIAGDQWNTQNIIKSLYVSEAIRNAGSKREVVKTLDPNNPPDVNDGDPSTPAVIGTQDDYQRVSPHEIDRALAEVDDRLGSEIDRGTVSRVLRNYEPSAGTAFATLNLTTQTALGALKPYKELAEKALSEILRLMLLWAYYDENPIEAYEADKRGAYGQQLFIEADTLDPQSIYISVELKPDVPTDRQQRANTASMLVQWGYPKEYALQDLGVTDPEAALRQSYLERWVEHKVTLQQQAEIAQMQTEIQAMQAQMQQQQEAQAMAQQQALSGPVPGGNGFAPNQGGQPPAQANPEITRELMRGSDQTGQELGGQGMA
jgi:hypothetical protein